MISMFERFTKLNRGHLGFSFRVSVRREIVLPLFLLLMAGLAWSQQTSATSTSSNLISHPGNVENWGSLALDESSLHPDRPLLGEKIETAQFTRELWQVKWRQGDPIDLYVIRPKNVAKPPVVLYLYSYPSETDRFRNDSYCSRLTKDGFAAVGFVSALTGQRYTNRPMKQWFVSELQESLGASVHDVQMILNYLTTRDDLDMSKVGMFGEGSGGTIAILSAAIDNRIKSLDVLDPWGDWPDWLAKSELVPEEERARYLGPEFLAKVAPLDPVQWLPTLKTPAIRLQQIMGDAITPQIAKQRMQAAAPSKTQLVNFDNTRDFFGTSSGGRIFQWVKVQLKPAASSQPALQDARTPDTQSTGHPRIEQGHDD